MAGTLVSRRPCNSLDEITSSSGDITVVTNTFTQGGKSFYFGPGGTVWFAGNYGTLSSVNGTWHALSFSARWDDTVPGVGEGADFWRFVKWPENWTMMSLRVEDNGNIGLYDDLGQIEFWNTGGGLTPNQWYRFGLVFMTHASSGALGPLLVDGVERIAQVTTIDTQDGSGTAADMLIHNTYGTVPPDPQNYVWFDNLIHVQSTSELTAADIPSPYWGAGVPILRRRR